MTRKTDNFERVVLTAIWTGMAVFAALLAFSAFSLAG